MRKLKAIIAASLVLFLSGFTALVEKTDAPKDMPKRTEDKNSGIIIPSFKASPYEIIEKSYDPLSAYMLDPEEGIFMGLWTSNFDFNPHKLTFCHEKFGFVTHNAYRVQISFIGREKPQKMLNFAFAPFEITSPKTESEVIFIAETWVKFFDAQGWKRAKQNPRIPYGTLPEEGESWPYMRWEADGFKLGVSITRSNALSEKKEVPKYFMHIVFDLIPFSLKK